MPNEKSDKNLIGAAGEYLVLSRLLSKGILASQAPRGTRKADILVNHLDDKPPCLIQVKTRSKKAGWGGGWILGVKHESIVDKDLFYCFVDLSVENPKIFVIPAKIVAKVVTESHQTWLDTPGKKNQKHNDSDTRIIKSEYEMELKSAPSGWMNEYLENWDLILEIEK
jgi:hypothetical protein